MSSSNKVERLGATFFDRGIHEVARDLVGRDLVRSISGKKRVGRITEVEVYEGANDRASHARSGEPTERTRPMFAEPGTIYVYTIYGMYQCLNFRAPSRAGPGAILIRSCIPYQGRAEMAVDRGLVREASGYSEKLDKKLMSGPAKICQALSIGTELSGSMVGEEVYVARGEPVWRVEPDRVMASVRVGLNRKTCGKCVDRKWRYLDGINLCSEDQQ